MTEILQWAPALWSGLKLTLLLTAGAALVAGPAALLAGLARLSSNPLISFPASCYIEIFRGTSALVQLFWFYYVLPHFGLKLDALTVGILVLGLHIGAYGAEIVRGAVQSVHKTQYEAAKALNFTRAQTLRRIILPQAFVAILPPAGNLLIELLKSTALVSMITLAELTFKGQMLRAATHQSLEIFGLVLLLYFMVSLCITYGVRCLEQKFSYVRD
ncbi:MAG: ectoine/hydroxyectoine ABC transporter permease subunit EhuC [Candidatus Nitrohelix vancouverensis]|uniref:Ectoine/hydroxyectoine ABC transporter permease subunit EhuC n=1 Tax=Candidatus Nitrohelix vancouverensis TaxID=2705534 RepID=A0A7T0C0Q7_9BACT|nr:MAG: ectoine/hydroxyectoine ABC transporter permease subunit EhuC [Candidatus Nitrohelix vancouverensis]